MTKKDLQEYVGLQREILQCKQIMHQMLMDIASPKAAKIDGQPHGSRIQQDPLATAIAANMDRAQEYAQRVEAYTQRCRQIERCIDSLPQDERECLRYRYIQGLRWVKIAHRMHRSESSIYIIHRRGLEYLEAEPEADPETL